MNAVNEDLVGLGRLHWCLLEVVGAGRSMDGRHELRLFFASGLPGLNYSQKTNLKPTSGDLWVWASVTSDDRWVWAGC